MPDFANNQKAKWTNYEPSLLANCLTFREFLVEGFY